MVGDLEKRFLALGEYWPPNFWTLVARNSKLVSQKADDRFKGDPSVGEPYPGKRRNPFRCGPP